MANEITINLTASCTNGNFTNRFAPGTVQITQTTQGGHMPIVVVGTSEEDLTLGDITTGGVICMRNLDTTNYVAWGPKSGASMVEVGRIRAGEIVVFRLGSAVTIRWAANTAACKVQVWALET